MPKPATIVDRLLLLVPLAEDAPGRGIPATRSLGAFLEVAGLGRHPSAGCRRARRRRARGAIRGARRANGRSRRAADRTPDRGRAPGHVAASRRGSCGARGVRRRRRQPHRRSLRAVARRRCGRRIQRALGLPAGAVRGVHTSRRARAAAAGSARPKRRDPSRAPRASERRSSSMSPPGPPWADPAAARGDPPRATLLGRQLVAETMGTSPGLGDQLCFAPGAQAAEARVLRRVNDRDRIFPRVTGGVGRV